VSNRAGGFLAVSPSHAVRRSELVDQGAGVVRDRRHYDAKERSSIALRCESEIQLKRRRQKGEPSALIKRELPRPGRDGADVIRRFGCSTTMRRRGADP
jgi:hypothetical protein